MTCSGWTFVDGLLLSHVPSLYVCLLSSSDSAAVSQSAVSVVVCVWLCVVVCVCVCVCVCVLSVLCSKSRLGPSELDAPALNSVSSLWHHLRKTGNSIPVSYCQPKSGKFVIHWGVFLKRNHALTRVTVTTLVIANFRISRGPPHMGFQYLWKQATKHTKHPASSSSIQ